MSVAAATAYDRCSVSGDQTFNAAAAARALADLEQHGGLVTKGQLAERWGITTQFAGDLIRRPGFPKPLQKFGRTGLYLYAEVLAFQRLQLQRPGRDGPRQPRYAAAIAAEPQHDVTAAKRAATRLARHGGLIDAAGAALRRGVSRQAVEKQLAKPGAPPQRAQAYAGLYLTAEVDAYFAGGPTGSA